MDPTERARQLRRDSTDAERRLWELLRRKLLGGYKFRRQEPIGRYIVDFLCLEQMLVVEVDGNQHADQREYDAIRDAWLRGQGYRVLRFSNREVLTETESVLEALLQALTE